MRKNLVPTRRPCSSEWVIHTMARSRPLRDLTWSTIYFSTFSVDCASKAEVGSMVYARFSKKRTRKNHVSDKPSNNKISAVPNPTAEANAIRCASPPLRLDQFRSQSSLSIPQASATRIGSSILGLRRVSVPSPDPSVILVLCALNFDTVFRKSRGVPGRSEGR